MDVREKLVELIHKAKLSMWGKNGLSNEKAQNSYIADYLIAHGVTAQEWISVKDRLPNGKKVIDGETYFKNVAVRVKGCGFEKIAFYDDEEKYWFDTNFFPVVGEVTHWCELPEWNLPQPTKGE